MRHVLRVGRDQRAAARPGSPAGRVQGRLRRRLGKYRRRVATAKLHERVRSLRRARRSSSGVAACTAPDGSYWAVQSWQRLLPMRGIAPLRPQQGAFGFNVSHWSGPIAQLDRVAELHLRRQLDRPLRAADLRGRAGLRLQDAGLQQEGGDGYARYVYIDTHDSVYGPGWKHDAAKVLHLRNGAFCYSFVPQAPPAGYPDRDARRPAPGDLERVTVMGPGVTPDVQWVGPGPRQVRRRSGRGVQRRSSTSSSGPTTRSARTSAERGAARAGAAARTRRTRRSPAGSPSRRTARPRRSPSRARPRARGSGSSARSSRRRGSRTAAG